MLQDWQTVMKASVDMRVDSCYRWAKANAAGDVNGVKVANELHASGAKIGRQYRPKDGGA